MSAVDFVVAKGKHLVWKTRIHSFLAGKGTLTEDQVVSHTATDLGKWLHVDGIKKYGAIPEMQKLAKAQIDLHATMKKILQFTHSAKVLEAQAEIAKIETISGEIIKLLTNLEAHFK